MWFSQEDLRWHKMLVDIFGGFASIIMTALVAVPCHLKYFHGLCSHPPSCAFAKREIDWYPSVYFLPIARERNPQAEQMISVQ